MGLENKLACVNFTRHGSCGLDIKAIESRIPRLQRDLSETYDRRDKALLESKIEAYKWIVANNRADLADPTTTACTPLVQWQSRGTIGFVTPTEASQQSQCNGYTADPTRSVHER